MRGIRVAVAGAVLAGGFALYAGGAVAGTFPGTNGKIAFSTSVDFNQIFVMGPDGQNPTPLTFGAVPGGLESSWSGDGERLAFAGSDGSDDEIFVMDHDGQNLTQLTFNSAHDRYPTFSPNGQTIAFESFVGGDFEIFAMDASGQGTIQLTDNTIDDRHPSFSPSGQQIAFDRGEEDVSGDIVVMDAGGQNQTPLATDSPIDIGPSWSPDGQRILFTRVNGMDRDLHAMDANGQSQIPLLAGPQRDLFGQFSPNGNQIVFMRDESLGTDTDIFVADADGQNAMPLTENAIRDGDPSWQPLNPPACELSGPPKQKSFGVVATTITCAENAVVAASGQGKAPKVPRISVATASKAKKFTLVPTTIEVQPDQPTPLTLTVPKKGKKALKKAAKAGKRGKAMVTTTATDDLGETAQASLAVKFKKKKK
jgi:dipeptidyl aminopeptidase/acylaminoacyl peptidase